MLVDVTCSFVLNVVNGNSKSVIVSLQNCQNSKPICLGESNSGIDLAVVAGDLRPTIANFDVYT